MTTEPDDITPADFADAFDDWIASASITKLSVPIYGKPGLAAEFQSLQREREQLMQVADGEPTLGETTRLNELTQRAEAIFEEWEASKAEWIVQDVSELTEQIRDALGPEPVPPAPLEEPVLPRGATEQQRKSHTIAVQKYNEAKPAHDAAVAEYEKALTDWHADYALHAIATAVVEIRFSDGRTVEGITVEQLRKMRKALGERQIVRLNDAVRQAMVQEPVIEAPFSPSTSQPDQT